MWIYCVTDRKDVFIVVVVRSGTYNALNIMLYLFSLFSWKNRTSCEARFFSFGWLQL